MTVYEKKVEKKVEIEIVSKNLVLKTSFDLSMRIV